MSFALMDGCKEIIVPRCKEITCGKSMVRQGARSREQLLLPGNEGMAGGQRSD